MSTPSTEQIVEMLLDPHRLGMWCERPVRATRIRIKPDTSVTVALATLDASARTVGWARVLWPDGRRKAARTVQAAERRGLRVVSQEIGAGLVMQHGGVVSDPKLAGHLARAVHNGLLGPDVESDLLRYNPMRRLVAVHRGRVVRVTVAPDEFGALLHRLVAPGVPLPNRLDPGDDQHVSVLEFTGRTDLLRHPDLDATWAAGCALGDLHTATRRLSARLVAHLTGRAPDPWRQASAHAALLDVLAPALARRLRELVARAELDLAGGNVLSHGDASPDQVLFDPVTGEVWLTDFDRACLAPAAADLGSYLSMVADDTARALLAGYRQRVGGLPEEESLRRARARAMLLRVADPLRAAAPDWRPRVSSALDQLTEVIG